MVHRSPARTPFHPKALKEGRPLLRDRFLAATGLTLAATLAIAPVHAQVLDTSPDPMKAAPQRRDENGEMMARRKDDDAVKVALTYNSDLNADIGGGQSRGAAYLQRIGLITDADLEQLIGWRGAIIHASVQGIEGNGISANRVGSLAAVSGLEAEPALRLFNLWVQQSIGPDVSLRVGQFTAGQEFAISSTAGLFVNSTFGWPSSFANDLPIGGSSYPLAGPGVRLAIAPSDKTTVRVAVFSGDPAGQGGGDPQRRNLHGFNGWKLAGAPFVIGEVAHTSGGSDPAWSMTLGGWVDFGHLDDLHFDTMGRSLASPLSDGEPSDHKGNYTVYAIADARLAKTANGSLHGFIRANASPADRNPVDLYFDAGLALTGPLRGRPDDVVGIGVGGARISPALRQVLRDRAAVAGTQADIPGYEGVIEVTYQAQIAPRAYLQPNVQVILNPSVALLDAGPEVPQRVPSALVVGLRTSLRL
jgi:porin